MERKVIDTLWDRITRNNVNHNFEELYNVRETAIESEVAGISEVITDEIRKSSSMLRQEPVATFADIETTYSNPQIGYAVMTRDTGKVYRYEEDGTWREVEDIDPTAINEVDSRLSEEIGESPYYGEVTYEEYRDSVSETEYHVTTIPHLDKSSNLIKLKNGYGNNGFDSGKQTAREFSNDNNLTMVANAGVFNMETGTPLGIHIQDGIILQDTPHSNNYTLGIKADNTLVTYDSAITAQDILADGCNDALTGFFPIIENGSPVDPTLYNAVANTSEQHPRQVIAQLSNNDILFLTVQGRDINGKGMTYDDLIRVASGLGATFAYCLDGGGSTQTVVRGALVNNPINDDGRTERSVSNFLYVEKDTNHPHRLKPLNYDLGKLSKNISDLSSDLGLLGLFEKIADNVNDLNKINENGMYWAGSSALNKPFDFSCGVLHWQAGSASALQLAIPYHDSKGEIKFRRTISDMETWTNWRSTHGDLIWNDITLLNNWVNNGGSEPIARYSKRNGVVYVRGTIKDGDTTGGTILFNLPEGYRPSERVPVITMSDTGSGREMTRLFVNTNGDVAFVNGGNRWLYTVFSFPVDE
ncbi:phosphodiester glycosidase family protein [Virgibacillus salexigens]|uniref:Phosphodiester glycosidase domain-containing protein n=1 Tax=Virgibacillus kapii TaxID=1638645 RepID=A0ABQ2D727_9BACI|nr:phosphodiester glycosidase family protein [Virgibacillus kapii]GGJ48437.1 hypothetical protein GCM10007111_08160 [Virgibacillus kapii]